MSERSADAAQPEASPPLQPSRPGVPPGARDAAPFELASDPFELTGDHTETGEAGQESPSRPRVRRILLASLLAVGLAGATVLGVTAWRIVSQKNATVTAPSEVAGMHIDTAQNATDT